MAFVNHIFEKNFIEYASYVVKERAIPHLDDGLKPVQRRILHSLFDKDDGKFHKVANIVGHCMQYHPHGDSSIYEALVNLANKDLFIDKQGNFGNLMTGDPASAARYIECRILSLAKDILYRPEITEYVDSYDGRKQEPVTFPAKVPLVVVLGAEGIAVGMSTRILPHNFIEVMEAEKACLQGEPFQLYPDFLTGGLVDVSEYKDGTGKVICRAKLDTSDDKKIVIRELPFGVTTESLIASVESAARRNKIKIGSIVDYTTENVEIEIKLPRNIYTKEVVDGLFAFTDCEVSISVNLLVIRDNKPAIMTVTEVIEYHAQRLMAILKKELELEKRQLLDRLHARTLERIFIEERIYKRIESEKTNDGIYKTVHKGLEPFQNEIRREVTDEDVERLLKIPIRRISLYDIEKMKKEMEEIKARIKEINHHLKNLREYAVSFLDGVIEKEKAKHPRCTEIMDIERVDIRDAAQRNLKMRYNKDTGYLGYEVSSGQALFDVSVYDRILIIKKDASYTVIDVPNKTFIGKGMLFCCLADKEELESFTFSLVYMNTENKYPYIKRTQITQFIKSKTYELVPKGGKLMKFTAKDDVSAVITYAQKSLTRNLEDYFPVENYLVKGVKSQGVRLKPKEFVSAKFVKTSTIEKNQEG